MFKRRWFVIVLSSSAGWSSRAAIIARWRVRSCWRGIVVVVVSRGCRSSCSIWVRAGSITVVVLRIRVSTGGSVVIRIILRIVVSNYSSCRAIIIARSCTVIIGWICSHAWIVISSSRGVGTIVAGSRASCVSASRGSVSSDAVRIGLVIIVWIIRIGIPSVAITPAAIRKIPRVEIPAVVGAVPRIPSPTDVPSPVVVPSPIPIIAINVDVYIVSAVAPIWITSGIALLSLGGFIWIVGGVALHIAKDFVFLRLVLKGIEVIFILIACRVIRSVRWIVVLRFWISVDTVAIAIGRILVGATRGK